MRHPCRQDCRERQWPGCRKDCEKMRAWNQLKEMAQAKKQRESLLDGYICDACHASKTGARSHDGRVIR